MLNVYYTTYEWLATRLKKDLELWLCTRAPTFLVTAQTC